MASRQERAPRAEKDGASLSKLADDVLGACSEALVSAGDLTADQVERIMGVARRAKKPKAADIQAILEEAGDLA